MPNGKIEALAAMIDKASKIAFFTGAGISTESGIPDFRSPGTGLWNKVTPIDFQDFVASEAKRRESWGRRFSGEHRVWADAKPNKGHLAVARLVELNKCIGVITQNVDNLHQNGGVPADKVIELHGNNSFARCLKCATRYELADLEQQFRSLGNVEPCSRCGGIIKSATISFGQAMPEVEMARAQEIVYQCDLMIVAGSSLVVYPAAAFPEQAKHRGAKLAIVNREPTPLDSIADLVVHDEIGPTLAFAAGIN